MQDETTERIGTFQIQERIGGGGFSEVLRARDLRPHNYGGTVVLKRLRAGLIHRDPVFLDSLLYEAEVGMMVKSQHVVRVDCVLDDGGEPTVVMEHIDGYRLDKVIRCTAGQGLHAEAVAEIVKQLCLGLKSLHDVCDAGGNPLEVIHQDVKPTNVMITPAGVVKLLDLGLARPGRPNLAAFSIRQGTPGYRSPEQSRGDSLLTAGSDLYAVGVIMYELFQGANLFSSEDYRTDNLVERQRQASISVGLLAARIAPPGLDVILQRLLAFDLSERYQVASDVVKEVENWQKRWNAKLRLSAYLERLQPRMDALTDDKGEPELIHCCDTQPGERQAVCEDQATSADVLDALPSANDAGDGDLDDAETDPCVVDDSLPSGLGLSAVEFSPFDGPLEESSSKSRSESRKARGSSSPPDGLGRGRSSARSLLRRIGVSFGMR